jgi:hypothetical protein
MFQGFAILIFLVHKHYSVREVWGLPGFLSLELITLD